MKPGKVLVVYKKSAGRETLKKVKQELRELKIPFEVLSRDRLKPLQNYDLVITIGGDGTFLESSHHLEKGRAICPRAICPTLMGVNSSPGKSVGFFCRTDKDNFQKKMIALRKGKARLQTLHRLKVTIDEKGKFPLALNDILFCNRNPAGTTRYLLKIGAVTEEQKSSGLWVSPPPGSTAAIKSAGGKVLDPGEKKFQYVVREPYQPKGRRYRLLKGIRNEREKVEIVSRMDNAAIYIDGPHFVCLVRRGAKIRIGIAGKPITAVW